MSSFEIEAISEGVSCPLASAAAIRGAISRSRSLTRGFAHGFAVLSETADFFYKCDELYNPEQELVVAWNDPALGISWGIDAPTLSARDAAGRRLADITNLPKYGSI